MTTLWYFAYGSNLARDQMAERTGPIGETKRVRLEGYRIAFNKRGAKGTGKANLVPDPAAVVLGVVYRCTPAALESLDKYEGVSSGHYQRTIVRVRTDEGEELEAIAYTAGKAYLDDALAPSPTYLATILRGARDHRLPEPYIRELEAIGTRRNPPSA